MRYSRLSCVGSITRSHILPPKKDHIVRRVGCSHIRDSIWRRHLPILRGVRMAEWLRPAVSGRDSQLSCVGSNTRLHILSPQKDHIVRRDGFNHVRGSIWRRHLPIFFRGQDGLVVKASRLCEVLTIKLRGFNYQFVHLVSTQKVHRLGGWC